MQPPYLRYPYGAELASGGGQAPPRTEPDVQTAQVYQERSEDSTAETPAEAGGVL